MFKSKTLIHVDELIKAIAEMKHRDHTFCEISIKNGFYKLKIPKCPHDCEAFRTSEKIRLQEIGEMFARKAKAVTGTWYENK